MKRQIIFLILFQFLTYSGAIGQNNNQRILDFLEKEMEKSSIPGLQLAIIKNNELVLSESLGLANVPFAVKTNENTIFSINSIAKIFTATAIMQLVEKAKLETECPVSKYLDGLPENWQNVTIAQLLSHTSGLPDIEDPNSGDLIGDKGLETAWNEVEQMPLQFEAGDRFSYNATNYLLLEKIIEKLSGTDYEKFIELNQFRVAEMSSTFYGDSYEVMENRSPTYSFYSFDKSLGDYVLGSQLLEVYEEFPIKADAGVYSSAEEVAKWIIALQSGKFLSNESIDEMWKPVKLNDGEYGGFGGLLNAYAYGWPVIKRESHPAVSPLGGGRASLTIYPKDSLSIILFTNLSGIPTYEIVENISKLYLN